MAVAVTAGCGLAAPEPSEPSEQSGQIEIGDITRDTQTVSCTQNEWSLTIEANADPGRAEALLQLGGEKPIVETVNIQNVDGRNAFVGGDAGDAEASSRGGTYTITGTAAGSDSANPGQTKDMPFKIEVPC
ncbi:MAG: lipoprotein LpqH [Mycobacterium sp.]